MFATYLLNVSLEKTTKANNRFLLIAHALSFPFSLTRFSFSHPNALGGTRAHPLHHRGVSDIHEHPRHVFAFPFPVFLFCFLLYCLYLLIFWNRHYSVCVFSLTLSLISYSVHYNIRFTSVYR